MDIVKIPVGTLRANCYILKKDDKVLVVDPGDEIDKIREVIDGKEVVGVLVTHGHFDHTSALKYFKDKTIYSYESVKEGSYCVGPFDFKVIFTKGHSSDCISFYFEEDKVMFTGDFLFYHCIGRCDLPTSSIEEMDKSISKIKNYPKEVMVYPGHGRKTTLEEEFVNNPYF